MPRKRLNQDELNKLNTRFSYCTPSKETALDLADLNDAAFNFAKAIYQLVDDPAKAEAAVEYVLIAKMKANHEISRQAICEKCGQTDIGQTGEIPCEVCGLPTVHDE